jgi:hypothetical protein
VRGPLERRDVRRLVPVAVGIIATAALTVLAALLGQISTWLAADPTSLGLEVLDQLKVYILVFLAVVAATSQILPSLRASRERRICESVRWYLEHIHRRNWPPDHKNTGLNSDFRVSVFVPHYKKKHLKCVHRTAATGTPSMVWRFDPEGGAPPHGLVGFIFAYRVQKEVASLPEVRSDQDVERYMQETFMSADEYGARSWKGAAMRGVPIQVTSDAIPVGVLLVECKRPGFKFSNERVDFDAEICGKILAGMLAVEGRST